jgi:hypothetical protein
VIEIARARVAAAEEARQQPIGASRPERARVAPISDPRVPATMKTVRAPTSCMLTWERKQLLLAAAVSEW